MQFATITRILGILIMVFSITMIPPSVVALIYQDGGGSAFFITFILVLVTGFLIFLPKRHAKKELKIRDGFLIVSLFWTVLSLFGAIPFTLIEKDALSIADAVFESFSGITTTGSTVISGIDELPHSILFYRQQLQWLGGMGIIVLAVAILPMLGIGGMQLYRAETPGPIKDSKLTPRIAGTAKSLWYIYLGLTIACALSYWLAGMSAFDAIGHSFSTVSTGGFSTHDASINHFESDTIKLIATFFMLACAVNFSLHFFAVNRLSIKPYFQDLEFKTFLLILATSTFVITGFLVYHQVFGFGQALIESTFHVVSFATSTGFAGANADTWPILTSILLFFIAFSAGCAGSTSGGIKIIRIIVLFKQGVREIKRLIHPNGVFLIKIDNKPVDNNIVQSVWGFFGLYMLLFFVMICLLLADGVDHVTAWSSVATAINNTGPGLGETAGNFSGLSDLSKYVLCFGMLLGRLEIFTLLVLFTPYFWRR